MLKNFLRKNSICLKTLTKLANLMALVRQVIAVSSDNPLGNA
jgi:hypothetical protein